MKTLRISGHVVRSIATVALALTVYGAGLIASTATAAESCTSGYVILDEHGNTVVPEWTGCDAVETGTVSEGYAIVGEHGAVYVPEHVADSAIEVAADTVGFAIVGEHGTAFVPETSGDGSALATTAPSAASGYAIVGEHGAVYVAEQAGATA